MIFYKNVGESHSHSFENDFLMSFGPNSFQTTYCTFFYNLKFQHMIVKVYTLDHINHLNQRIHCSNEKYFSKFDRIDLGYHNISLEPWQRKIRVLQEFFDDLFVSHIHREVNILVDCCSKEPLQMQLG